MGPGHLGEQSGPPEVSVRQRSPCLANRGRRSALLSLNQRGGLGLLPLRLESAR